MGARVGFGPAAGGRTRGRVGAPAKFNKVLRDGGPGGGGGEVVAEDEGEEPGGKQCDVRVQRQHQGEGGQGGRGGDVAAG